MLVGIEMDFFTKQRVWRDDGENTNWPGKKTSAVSAVINRLLFYTLFGIHLEMRISTLTIQQINRFIPIYWLLVNKSENESKIKKAMIFFLHMLRSDPHNSFYGFDTVPGRCGEARGLQQERSRGATPTWPWATIGDTQSRRRTLENTTVKIETARRAVTIPFLEKRGGETKGVVSSFEILYPRWWFTLGKFLKLHCPDPNLVHRTRNLWVEFDVWPKKIQTLRFSKQFHMLSSGRLQLSQIWMLTKPYFPNHEVLHL